ncbi:hypothetical protein BH23GEM3_BH23GEM3_05020 [soil metagenome]
MIINRLSQTPRTSCGEVTCQVTGRFHRENLLSMARRADSVLTSDAGYASAQAVVPVVRDPGAELTPEQISRLLHRIETGAYDCLEIVDAVARRILASGDLASPLFATGE